MEESFAPGAVVAEVARRHEVYANLLHRWRRAARVGSSSAPPLLPVTVTPGCAATAPGTIEIELSAGVCIRVDSAVDEAALGRVLRVLSR